MIVRARHSRPGGPTMGDSGGSARSLRLRLSLSVTAWMAPPRPGFAPVPVGLVRSRSRIAGPASCGGSIYGSLPGWCRRSGPPWNDLRQLPSATPAGPSPCSGAMGADERLSQSVPRRLFDSFEKMSLPGAPLRNRTVDLLLTMSIPGRNSTAATLARAGFVVVLVLVNVSGFRLVLARGWHGRTISLGTRQFKACCPRKHSGCKLSARCRNGVACQASAAAATHGRRRT